ncbi:MAG: HD family phosphohydrolase, partial [Cytophagia bacterium]|nr:HD family phosphohydrolase [Cytophagia bacterium]
MIDTLLVRKARAFAEDMLQKFPKEYVYHNISHTTEVAKAAEEIGTACKLDDDAIETVVVAAWLHDTG